MSTSITLGKHYEQYVRSKLESGQYNNASEVIRAALRLLEEQDELREVRLRKLNAALDAAAGRPTKPAAEVMGRAKAKLTAKEAGRKGR